MENLVPAVSRNSSDRIRHRSRNRRRRARHNGSLQRLRRHVDGHGPSGVVSFRPPCPTSVAGASLVAVERG
ncbi:hypothetical protein G3I24_46540, partial [Micromonospora aurantiaca]|nr:hypothetical protein [Micromonospora aurantiaca]